MSDGERDFKIYITNIYRQYALFYIILFFSVVRNASIFLKDIIQKGCLKMLGSTMIFYLFLKFLEF